MTVDRRGASRYYPDQVLITLRLAVPRADDAVFLCPTGFAPMGDGPVRKAGRTSSRVLSTSPASALISADQVSTRSNPL